MTNKKTKSKLFQKIENKSIGNMPLSEFLVKLGYFLSLVIIIPLLFPTGRSFQYTDLSVGSVATKKVIAPFRFPILKMPEELALERQQAKQKIPFIFQENDTSAQIQILSLKELFRHMDRVIQESELNIHLRGDAKDNKKDFGYGEGDLWSECFIPDGIGNSKLREIRILLFWIPAPLGLFQSDIPKMDDKNRLCFYSCRWNPENV